MWVTIRSACHARGNLANDVVHGLDGGELSGQRVPGALEDLLDAQRRRIGEDLLDRTAGRGAGVLDRVRRRRRSEEHTSELQSRRDLVCRLLLEKKKNI